MPLSLATNRFPDPDAAYAALAAAHRTLNEEDSAALNARLVLILANEIGDFEILKAAIALAGEGPGSRAPQARR